MPELANLPEDTFRLWLESIDAEDRYEFFQVDGGSQDQAKFVCAYDRLLATGERAGRRSAHVTAYAQALGTSFEEASRRAQGFLQAPAVQSLLQKIFSRDRIGDWIKIEHEARELLKEMLVKARGSDDLKLQDTALRHAETFGRFVQSEETEARRERSRAAMDLARSRTKSTAKIIPTAEQLNVYLLALREEVGHDVFYRAIAEMEPTRQAQLLP